MNTTPVKILYGVGVGPGDPELITLQALRILREADVVLVPVMSPDEPGRAEAIVRANVDREITRVVFALNEREDAARREAAWDAAAHRVIDDFSLVDTVAFATIGDANVYSTFTYLAQTVRERMPEVEIRTVAGITAMQDLAARSNTVLCEGTEPLLLVPFTAEGTVVEQALDLGATVVTYKAGRRIDDLKATLRRHGRLDDAVFGAHLGLADEQIAPAADVDNAPYLSTVIAPANRVSRGGKL